MSADNVYHIERYDPFCSVGFLLGRVRAELVSALEREFATDSNLSSLGITAAQFNVMAGLTIAQEEKSAGDLCREMSYDPSALTRIIDRLEKRGLVRRVACLNDRRRHLLEITDKGRAAYPRMREISMAVQNRFLRGFARSEVRKLEVLLRRMLDNA